MDSADENTTTTQHCTNCKAPLLRDANYCQQCGQRKREVKWSFRGFLGDLFEHYLALDTKIGHTLYPFFFKPGQLTLEYITGRRAHYVQPIRLYLFSSIVFFFLLALLGSELDLQQVSAFNSNEPEDVEWTWGQSQDSFLYSLPGISNPRPIWTPQNSTVLLSPKDKSRNTPTDIDLEISTDGEMGTSLDSIIHLANDLTLTPEEVVEKSRISKSDLSPTERQIFIRLVRIWRTSVGDIYQLIVRNIPFMMFLLVPLFALLLKLAYFRRKNWLVLHHIVHSLHLHSFFYLLGAFVLLIFLIPGIPSIIQQIVLIGSIFWLIGYGWQSLRRVYGRSITKTSITFLFIVGLYFFLVLISLITEILLSLFFI